MSVTINARSLSDMLDAYTKVTGKGVAELTRAYARICAVELANRTQPWTAGKGNGAIGKAAGERAVDQNIRKVISDKSSLRGLFEKTKNDSLRKTLLRLLNAGHNDYLAVVMYQCKLITSPDQLKIISGKSEIKSTHQAARSPRTGRTYYKPGTINLTTEEVGGYIKEVQERVGYSKSGWAECARAIGGVKGDGARGIPGWAKRQRGSNWNVKDNSADKKNPHFVMTNTTPWITRLIDENAQLGAAQTARDKMIKALDMAFIAAKRGASAADESIKNSTNNSA
jgi:hypothetical protein